LVAFLLKGAMTGIAAGREDGLDLAEILDLFVRPE
jgi:hypothetical protein